MSSGPFGKGKLTFGGVDITRPPYYAGLALETKYHFLEGFTSQQFTTSPTSLITTRPYLKDWLITDVIQLITPDQTRETLMAARIALAELIDPTNGEQQLIHDEFAGSYFLAKRQSSSSTDEQSSPYLNKVSIDWACTGPAYSVTESIAQYSISTAVTTFTLTSDGDTEAYPLWTINLGGIYTGGMYPLTPTFTITNTTTGETISWTGEANFGDVLEFVMDSEYGTPYTVLQNGEELPAVVKGPMWPRLVPGENNIQFVSSLTSGILTVQWRDRFMVGQRVVPTPITPPTVLIPTGVTILGVDTPSVAGSYTFTGTVVDIYNNPMPSAPVTLRASTNSHVWTNVQTVTTNATGAYAFSPTPVYSGHEYFYVAYGGSPGYASSVSMEIPTYPPAQRAATEISITSTNSDNNYTFTGMLGLSANYPGVPLSAELVYIQVAEANSSWTILPGMEPPFTDGEGNYTYDYQVGLGTTWYSAWFKGNLQFGASWSNVIAVTNNTPWSPQLPGPITYKIFLSKGAIDAGALQYFAAVGFTEARLGLNAGDGVAGNVYATELATIKALGMVPSIDVEGVTFSGISWANVENDTQAAYFTAYFEALVAAGWTIAGTEHGNTGYPNGGQYIQADGFKGYINYNWPFGPNTGLAADALHGQKVVSVTNGSQFFNGETCVINNITTGESEWCIIASGGGTNTLTMESNLTYDYHIGYQGVELDAYCYWDLDPYTTANEFEYYGTYALPYIQEGTAQAAIIGIPNGLMCYPWIDPSNSMDTFNNSLTGQGNTYQALFDWAYANGMGYNSFTVLLDGNFDQIYNQGAPNEYFLLFYLMEECDTVVTNLQQTYPPAGTSALKNITKIQPALTLNITQASNNTYTFSGMLTELLTGDPIAGANVVLQVSTDGGITWADETTMGADPAVTDSSGAWTSSPNISLSAGQYNFRVKYVGTGAYLNTYAPYSHYGAAVTAVSAGGTATTLAISAQSSTPLTSQNDTITATLSTGVGALSGKSVTIYHYDSNGVKTTDYTGTTNGSGVVTFTGNWATTGTLYYYAYFPGDGTYQSATSTEVTINVSLPSTTTTLTVNTSTPSPGQTITFVATLVGGGEPLLGQSVTIYHYLGGVETVDTVGTTDSNGMFTYSTSLSTIGAYTYYASFAAAGIYPSSTSSVVDVNVYTQTAITLSATNTSLSTAQPVTFTANLSTDIGPFTAQTVTIYHYLGGAGPTTDTTGTTDTNGNFAYTTSFATVGAYTYYASFAQTGTYEAATSSVLDVSVTSNTTVALSVSNAAPTTTQPITFTATLTAANTGLAGESVTIYHLVNTGVTNDVTATTNGSGQITFTTTIGTAGAYTYYATFAGDSNYNGDTSSAVVVTVGATTYLSKVSSALANTSTGYQTFTGVGFEPTAVIFWWTPISTSNTWVGDSQFGMGFAAYNGSSYSQGYIATAGHNNVIPSAERRRWSSTGCIGLVSYDGSTIAEGAIINFNHDGFTINWGTAPYFSAELNYLCLGGGGYSAAQVVPWISNTTTGNQTPASGLGFAPGCVITIGTGDGTASPSTALTSVYHLGAMDSTGGEWAMFGIGMTANTPSAAGRVQQTDSCIIGAPTLGAVTYKASYVSMNSDGFTINWGTADGTARNFLSLCLTGGAYKVGSWTKSTAAATVNDTVTTTGVTPVAVLLATDSSTTASGYQSGYRLGIGGSDGTGNAVVTVTAKNGVNPCLDFKYFNYWASLVTSNNDAASVDASSFTSSLNTGNFVQTWTYNNNVATQICYIAIGHP